jgi:hypothetical protein
LAISAPPQVTGTGTSGSAPLNVRAGYNGVVGAKAFGLVAPATNTVHLVGEETAFDPDAPEANAAVAKVTIAQPAGTKVSQFATYDSDYPAGTDLDLFVYQDGALVGASAGTSAEETVTLEGGGTFDVYVVQFALAGSLTEQDVHLRSFAVGATNAGNVTVTPASRQATLGQQVTFTLSWNGLTAGTRYLGVVEYSDNSAVRASTVVQIRA